MLDGLETSASASDTVVILPAMAAGPPSVRRPGRWGASLEAVGRRTAMIGVVLGLACLTAPARAASPFGSGPAAHPAAKKK